MQEQMQIDDHLVYDEIRERLAERGYPGLALDLHYEDSHSQMPGIAFTGDLGETALRKIAGRLYGSREQQRRKGYRRVRLLRQHRSLLTLFTLLEDDPALRVKVTHVNPEGGAEGESPVLAMARSMKLLPHLTATEVTTRVQAWAPELLVSQPEAIWARFLDDLIDDLFYTSLAVYRSVSEAA